MQSDMRKVVIVGAGDVGASFAYALALSGMAEEIVLNDINQELASGQALDLSHGLPFMKPVQIRTGTVSDYTDAAVVVITAGVKQRPGESRLSLLERNAEIVTKTMDAIVASRSNAIVIIVTNPVDILTYVAIRHSGLPPTRIFGSGTVLDSARFRYLLSHHCAIDARNIHAYILGEHGDSEIAAWSMTHVAGIPIDQFCATCLRCGGWCQIKTEITEKVRNSAYHIIDYKGSTCYGIGLALVRIVGAVLRNERSILTLSILINNMLGIDDVCFSLPCIVSAEGAIPVEVTTLTKDEIKGLQRSADILRSTLDELDAGGGAEI